MRTRSTRVAWSMLAVFAVGYGAAPLSVANGNFQRQPGFYLAMVLAFTAFMVVGAVIVAHRPGNASAGSSRPSACCLRPACWAWSTPSMPTSPGRVRCLGRA
jgi:hypothetical protein